MTMREEIELVLDDLATPEAEKFNRTWANQMLNAQRATAAASAQMVKSLDNLGKATKEPTEKMSDMEKSVKSLLNRFLGITAVIQGVRAVGREFMENSQHVRTFSSAVGDLVDTMTTDVANSDGFTRLMDGAISRVRVLSQVIRESGIVKAMSALKFIAAGVGEADPTRTVEGLDVRALIDEQKKKEAAFAAQMRSGAGYGSNFASATGVSGYGGRFTSARGVGDQSDELSRKGMSSVVIEGEGAVFSRGIANEDVEKGIIAEGAKRRDIILGLEADILKGKEDLHNAHTDRMKVIAEEQFEFEKKNMDTRLNLAKDFAAVGVGFFNTLVDAAVAASQGQQVAFDKVIAGFLLSTGQQLLASGIADMLEGTSRIPRHYGADPTAYGLQTAAGIKIAAGAAMIAGSIPLFAIGGGKGAAAGAAGGGGPAGSMSNFGGDKVGDVRKDIIEVTLSVDGVALGRAASDGIAKARRVAA